MCVCAPLPSRRAPVAAAVGWLFIAVVVCLFVCLFHALMSLTPPWLLSCKWCRARNGAGGLDTCAPSLYLSPSLSHARTHAYVHSHTPRVMQFVILSTCTQCSSLDARRCTHMGAAEELRRDAAGHWWCASGQVRERERERERERAGDSQGCGPSPLVDSFIKPISTLGDGSTGQAFGSPPQSWGFTAWFRQDSLS